MKFVQLAAKLKEEISPVYLVEGDEAYFRDYAVRSIREACSISNAALNDVRVEGETLKGEKLRAFVSDLYALPFLDNYRLVRVCEFYPTEKEWEGALAAYVKAPCPSTKLVIVNGGKKANACDLKRKSGVVYVDCSRESEEMLSGWVFGVMRRARLSVDADAATLLVRYCARDAARIRTETEKLRLLLGEGGRVTREVVENEVAKDAEYKIYELTQAASRRNFSAFSVILHDLMEKGYDEYAALSSLTAHYRTLYEISNMRGTDAEIASALGMQPYAVKKSRAAAESLGRERVAELYGGLYALAADARSGYGTKSGALTVAIAKIFFG